MKRNHAQRLLLPAGLLAGLLIGGEAFATHLSQVTDIQTGETTNIPSGFLETGELNVNPHCHGICDGIFGHADPGGALGHGEGFLLENFPTPFHDAGDFTGGTLIGLSIDAPEVSPPIGGGARFINIVGRPAAVARGFYLRELAPLLEQAAAAKRLAVTAYAADGSSAEVREGYTGFYPATAFGLVDLTAAPLDEEFGGGVCTGSGCPETLVLDCQAGSCPEQGFTYTCVGACPETINFACESGDCSDILSVSCAGDACASTLDVSCDGGACFTSIGLSCAGGVCPDEVSLTCTEGGCSEAQSLDLDIFCGGGVCPDEVAVICTEGGCSEAQSLGLDLSCVGDNCFGIVAVMLQCKVSPCSEEDMFLDIDMTCAGVECAEGLFLGLELSCTGAECDAYADEAVVELTWPVLEEGEREEGLEYLLFEDIPRVSLPLDEGEPGAGAFSFHAEGGMNQGSVVLADRGNIDNIIDGLTGGHAFAIPGSDPNYRALAVNFGAEELSGLTIAMAATRQEPAELVSARNRLKETLAARREADQRFSDKFGQWLEDEGWEGGKVNDQFWLYDPPQRTFYAQRRQLILRFGYSPEGQAVKAAKDDASVEVREALAYLYSEVLPRVQAAAAKSAEGYEELDIFAKALGEALEQSDAETVDSDIVSILDELEGIGILD